LTELKNQTETIIEKKFNIVFGNQNLRLDDLKKLNPQLLRQVHGSTIIKSSNMCREADGHWTDSHNQALVIKTADCLPIFIFDRGRAFALHAGWRGVKKRILSKALEMCHSPRSAQIYIGPHIQMKSFQLDHASSQGLLKEHNLSVPQALRLSIARPSITQENHYHISLGKLVIREAQSYHLRPAYISPIDTFLSPQHNSYRRNRLNQQRNFSLITLTG